MRFLPHRRDSAGALNACYGGALYGVGFAGWKRMIVGWLVAGMVLLGHLASGSGATVAPEYQIKAQLLVNLATFTTWPAGTFKTTNSPIVIGIVGKDPFEQFLVKAVEARARGGRPLKLKHVGTDAEMKECHILFVASSERRRLKELKTRWKGAPFLTVGEADEFLDNGGIINFVLKGQLVRFEISLESAKAAGLKLDAKLLSVADSVRGKYD
ncbi:MAG: YfiR family protein [Verrucomicrobia bacterium]|nr:YfiR family protein [Verrucomicrobiota bacterium]